MGELVMYSKKMLTMLAKRYLSIQSSKGIEEAKEWERRMFKGNEDLVKQIIPYVHELQAHRGTPK